MPEPSKARLMELFEAEKAYKRARADFAELSAVHVAEIKRAKKLVDQLVTELTEGKQSSMEELMEEEDPPGGDDDN